MLCFYSPAPIPDDEAARQAAVHASGALLLAGDPVLQALAEQAAARFSAPMAAVSIIDDDLQFLVAGVNLPMGQTSRACSFCSHAITAPSGLLCVSDARKDGRFAGNPLVVADPQLRFYAGAALMAAGGQPLGALCVLDTAPRAPLDAQEAHDLRSLAQKVMLRIAERQLED